MAKKKLILGTVAALAVVGIGSAVAGGGDDSSTAAPSPDQVVEQPSTGPAPSDDPLSDGGWTASDIQVEPSQFGTSVSARVTNTEESPATGIFTLTAFDPSGARVGEFMGSANEVEPGTASTVTFVGTSEQLPDPASLSFEFESSL